MAHSEPQHTTSIAQSSAITSRKKMLHGIDGRSAHARRLRDLTTLITREIGGPLTEVERITIRNVASLVLRQEQLAAAIVRGENVNTDDLVRISGTARRLINAIAKRDKPKGPSLTEYLQGRAA